MVLVACAALAWVARRPAGEQGVPVVALLSNGATEVTVAQGTPIVLEIFVTGVRNSKGPVIGSWLKPWHELIALQATSNGQSVPLAVVTTEAPRVRELVSGSDRQPGVRGNLPRAAALDGANRVFHIEVAAAPETMEQLAPGRYEIVAVVKSPWWQVFGWRGREESPPLATVVSAKASASDETHLAAIAQYFLKTGQFDDALRAARSWVVKTPQNPAAQTMAGDVLAASGDTTAARRHMSAHWSLRTDSMPANRRRPSSLASIDSRPRRFGDATLRPAPSGAGCVTPDRPTLLMRRIRSVLERQ